MAGPTIFRATRVWDGAADSAIIDGFVRVDDTAITAVGRWADLVASNADTSDGAPVVDCGDTTLLPGLVNAHVHLTLSGSTTVLDPPAQAVEGILDPADFVVGCRHPQVGREVSLREAGRMRSRSTRSTSRARASSTPPGPSGVDVTTIRGRAHSSLGDLPDAGVVLDE